MKLPTFPALATQVLATLILVTSCTSGSEGIFASIEREQKIISLGGLSATATVTSMAELGSVSKYFATGGKALFSRSTDPKTTTWHKATVGGEAATAAVGVAGSKVFAVAGGSLFWSSTGSVWTKVALGADTAYDLVPVRQGDGVSSDSLIVVTSTSSSYKTLYLIDSTGALSAAVSLSSNPLAAPVRSAVYDGSDYYLLSETTLWKMTPGLVTSEVAVTGVSGHDYAGLIYLGAAAGSTHQGYYLSTLSNSTSGGGIYKAPTTAGAFTAVKTAVKDGTNPVGFGSWLYNKENDSLWIGTGSTPGTEGSGYMELMLATTTLSTTPKTNSNNYTSSPLPSSTVGTFFRSSSGISFLGTIAHGLWSWDATKKIWSQQ